MKKYILIIVIGLILLGSIATATEEWILGQPVQTDTTNDEWVLGTPYIITEAEAPPPPTGGQFIMIQMSMIPLFLIFTLVCFIRGKEIGK